MRGYDFVCDAGAMSRGRNNSTEGLIGYRADVAHSKSVFSERGVKSVEGNASLSDDVVILGVNLIKIYEDLVHR